MRYLAFLLILITSLPAFAQPSDGPFAWEIVHEESTITFHPKQMGAEFDGEFTRFDGEILFGADVLDNNKVRIEIDLASAATQSTDREERMQSDVWFDTANFPKAVFESTGFTAHGGTIEEYRYTAYGNLTIKGTTQEHVFNFTLGEFDKGDHIRAEMTASTKINRLDYNLGLGDWADNSVVSHEIPVKIKLVATRKK